MAAERLFGSLREIVHAFTHRIRRASYAPARATFSPPGDLSVTAFRRATRTECDDDDHPERYREIVLMNDHAVSRMFDRRQSPQPEAWPD